MNNIHPTAIVEPGAVLGKGNVIGPFVFIGSNVTLGDDNRLEGYSSVGRPAEHREYYHRPPGPVVLGSRNVIREFTTLNAPTHGVTRMANDCTMLRGSHLSHDSILEDHVTVSCNVLIGGETYVMRGANLGLGSIIHQQQVIGAYAMLGMGTVVPRSTAIEPGNIYVGNPARALRENTVGLQRAKVDAKVLADLREHFNTLLAERNPKAARRAGSTEHP